MAQARSDITKSSLVSAAFKLFANKGYAATSTREIAALAETNIASINYHFGGKAGLRRACAQTIVEQMSRLRNAPDTVPMPTIATKAETAFEAFVLRQAHMLMRLEQAEPMIQFLLREAHEKSEVFDHVYEHFFVPAISSLAVLWTQATGGENEGDAIERTRLILFSIVGQIAYFRIGQPLIARHLGWQGYSAEEADKVLSVLQVNLRALVEAHRNPS